MLLQMLSQPLRLRPERALGPARQYNQRGGTICRGTRNRLAGCLFEYDVNIGAAESEAADAGKPWRATTRPRHRFIGQLQRRTVQLDMRIERSDCLLYTSRCV